MRVLFFLPHTRAAAGCRYRVHQYIPYLESQGVQCELRELVGPALYRIMYEPGRRLEKVALFARDAASRIADIRDARNYDVIFVHRECFPIGPAFIETLVAKSGKPIVYDFDDAIFLARPDPLKNLLRWPGKTGSIVQLADQVIVSNEHLRNFCSAYNPNVHIVRTSVDTDVQFRPRAYPAALPPDNGHPVRLGWIGSHSTAKYLQQLRPVLQRIAAQRPVELLVVGAGAQLEVPGLKVINKAWSLDTEVGDFQSLDIGLYPLEDGIWELGKAGFKAVQYMAVGVPAVVSRVGMAVDIIRNGENGFLVSSEEEWLRRLTELIDSTSLRQRLAAAGRRTIEEGFSIRVNAPKILDVLRRAAARA
jgi:glycosyltransferase involved in cell wall biosynthesis